MTAHSTPPDALGFQTDRAFNVAGFALFAAPPDELRNFQSRNNRQTKIKKYDATRCIVGKAPGIQVKYSP